MNYKTNSRLSNFVPFLIIGIAIVICITIFLLLAYAIVWGMLIGAVLWLAIAIKNKFFPRKQNVVISKPGRTIDHRDIE